MITRHLALSIVENTIYTLELPLRDPMSFKGESRSNAFDFAVDLINDLYDLSLVDSFEKDRFLDLIKNAYIHGGL